MHKPLKKYFPSIAVSPVGLAGAAGVAWKPGAQFSCPQCNRRGESGETLTAVRDDCGGWVLTPCRKTTCGWSGSLFDHFMDSHGLSPQAAIRELKRRGAKIPRRSSTPQVLAAWQRDRDARRALNALAWRMENQHLPGPFHAHQLAAYGLTEQPHHHPLWWTTTAADLDTLTGRAAKPSNVSFRRLGITTMEEMGHPTVAIPLWEAEGVLAGFYGLHPSEDHGFVRQKPGSTGIGFLYAKDWKYPPWGEYGAITSHARTAIVFQAANALAGQPVPIVYVPPGSDPRVVAKKLAGRPWIYHADGGQALDEETVAKNFALARLLSARVTYSGAAIGRDRHINISTVGVDWWQGLARHIEALIVSAQRIEAAADLLRQVGGGDATIEKVRTEMSVSLFEKLRTQLAPKPLAFRSVEVAPGVTLSTSDTGWIWDETGEVVVPAYPAEVKAYRAGSRTRHRGVVVYDGKTYQFDSSRFRKDPGAVIESALLKGGVLNAPPLHPRVLPHIAAAALYFSQPAKR